MRPRRQHRTVPPPTKRAIRKEYEIHGVEQYYQRCAGDYQNPHEPTIRKLLGIVVPLWQLDLCAVLDLACGSGEVTLALRELGAKHIQGIDPYTGAAYEKRTGQTAEKYSFADLADGALAGRKYSLIVCSFALHLA